MKLILTRHGETIENKNGIMMGHNPGRLTKKGEGQAKEISKKLVKEKIDLIYSSDLNRAKKTSEIINQKLKLPIFFTKQLREKDIKEYAGKKKIDFGFKKTDFTVALLTSKTGETNQDIIKRAKNLIEYLKSKYKNKTILIVSHNAFIRAIMVNLINKDFKKIRSLENLEYKIFKI